MGLRGVPKPIAIKPTGDMLTRFDAQTSKIESGELFLPKEAPWLAEFEKETLGFPQGKHDDRADALARLVNWGVRRQGQEIATFSELIRR